ncbi:MAG: IS66 family insertion sequence element accessory protein TnpB [Lachnospiraceae bacterium]|nr:IS66 family insertion sequence element accessory protein TnpB [Lachnospiraceae bacterium]
MDKTTHDVRLAHWKQIIEQCRSRPEGQTAKQWLSENGINDKSYYYWLRKIRKQVYEESSATAMLFSRSEDHTINPVPTSSEPGGFLSVARKRSFCRPKRSSTPYTKTCPLLSSHMYLLPAF